MDKKQLAVFVPQHFSQQFFAYYLGASVVIKQWSVKWN